MTVLTREERRKRVLELHNQGMGTREIAKLLHMSFTDIGKILRDADEEKEAEEQQTRQEFLSSKAYQLYSQGTSPVQVAIELNIRASEAIVFHREYCELADLRDLSLIYKETKSDLWAFLNLHRSARAAGMGVPHIEKLLKIANNYLPSIESRYEDLRQKVNSLTQQKRDLYNQVTREGSNLEYQRVACQRETAKFEVLQNKRMKEETLARHFRNNDAEYLKIIKAVREKVYATLSDGKKVIKLAVFAVTESIRENPTKYSQLVQQGMSYTTTDFNQDFNPLYMYEPPQQQVQPKDYFIDDYVAMLVADANKLYNTLAKDVVDEILNNYTVTKPSPSLPILPAMDENFAQLDRSEETK